MILINCLSVLFAVDALCLRTDFVISFAFPLFILGFRGSMELLKHIFLGFSFRLYLILKFSLQINLFLLCDFISALSQFTDGIIEVVLKLVDGSFV